MLGHFKVNCKAKISFCDCCKSKHHKIIKWGPKTHTSISHDNGRLSEELESCGTNGWNDFVKYYDIEFDKGSIGTPYNTDISSVSPRLMNNEVSDNLSKFEMGINWN